MTIMSSVGWKHYTIPLGEFLTGDIAQLVLAADDDATGFTESLFSNIRIYESKLSINVNGTMVANTLATYATGQDYTPTLFGVEDDGATLHLQGNTWKRFDLGYRVTQDTLLEFDFRSGDEGEIHAIGLDTNNYLNGGEHFFQLFGTQSWWGHQDFNDYNASVGWKHYTIPLGEFLTGDIAQLVLAADDDATGFTESLFSNIRIYESKLSINVNGTTVTNTLATYTTDQDLTPTLFGVEDDGATLHLQGNTWKRFDLGYRVTQDTLLEFDFRSGDEGEIHAIGLDTNNFLNSGDHFFQLCGTQSWWGHQDFNNYDVSVGWQHYTIPLGEFLTGDIAQLVFAADDDISESTESLFSNIRIHERQDTNDPPTIISTPVITATEDTAYSYDVNATDPDVGDTLTYSLVTQRPAA